MFASKDVSLRQLVLARSLRTPNHAAIARVDGATTTVVVTAVFTTDVMAFGADFQENELLVVEKWYL